MEKKLNFWVEDMTLSWLDDSPPDILSEGQ